METNLMDSSIYLLPFVASICLLFALFQAWLMTLVRYFDSAFVKRCFPNYRDLIRSHVDYLIMSGIVLGVFAALMLLKLQVSSLALWLVAIGAFYNPFGFFLQAIKPDIVDGGGWPAKTGAVLGFMPLSIGLIWISIEILIFSFRMI